MTPTIRELEQAYDKAYTEKEKAEILLELCKAYRHRDLNQMLVYAREAEAHARKARFRKGIAMAVQYEGIALLNATEREVEEGIAKLNRALEIYRELKEEKKVIEVLYLLGNSCSRRGLIDEAVNLFREAEGYCDPSVPSKELALIYNEWIGIYKAIGNPEKVMEYANKMLAMSEAIAYRPGLAWSYFHLGFINRGFGDSTKAIQCFQKGLEFCGDEDTYLVEHYFLFEIGLLHMEANELDKALDYARQFEAFAASCGYQHLKLQSASFLCDVLTRRKEFSRALQYAKKMTRITPRTSPMATTAYVIRGEVHTACGELDEAIAWYEKALALVYQVGPPHLKISIYKGLSKTYEEQGDVAGAYHYYRSYMAIQEELLGTIRQKAVASSFVMTELQQTERELKRTQKKMRELSTKIERQQQELASASLLVAEKNTLLADLRAKLNTVMDLPSEQLKPRISGLLSQLGRSMNPPQAWEEFSRQLQLADPGFLKALTRHYGHLTPNELKICSLLRVNLTTKEIAEFLAVQPSSVDLYRTAIRKKLGLEKGENLTTFLGSL